LTRRTTDKIRTRLENEKKRIQSELEQLIMGSLPGSDGGRIPTEIGMEADESTELEKRVATASRLKASLYEVEQAIEKLDLGTYGLCEKCKKAISPARLEVLPQAALCLECKHKTKPEKVLSGANEYWNTVMPFYDSSSN
jgi:DnaK suppressor protein